MSSKIIRDRQLETRGYLQFEFPIEEESVDFKGINYSITPTENKTFFEGPVILNKVKYRMPFYENIEIRESKQSNFIDIPVIGRNTPFKLFSHGEGRVLNISFFLTLPHLYHWIRSEHGKLSLAHSSYSTNYRDMMKKQFRRSSDTNESDRQFYELLLEDVESAERAFNGDVAEENFILKALDSALEFLGGDVSNNTSQARSAIKAVYLSWLNLIRVSGSNSVTAPRLGPPVIKLNYGEMYKNVPCICSNYTITPVDRAGYDLQTLIPHRVEVNMNLVEVRVGDFGEFDRTLVGSENDYGFDSVLEHGRIDYRSDF